jgi:hypothetical protein
MRLPIKPMGQSELLLGICYTLGTKGIVENPLTI